jgi:hypothetical protein
MAEGGRLMTVTIRVPRSRALALVLTGAALGAMVVAPVAARVTASAVEPAVTDTRSVSCAGLSFYPASSATEYASEGTVRYSVSQDAYYSCAPGLPNKAVVTRVRFTLYDQTSDGQVEDCGLVRSGLSPTTATVEQDMAHVPPTGSSPGIVRLADTSISRASVDNGKWAYHLRCIVRPPLNGQHRVGIIGADVTYSIDSADG